MALGRRQRRYAHQQQEARYNHHCLAFFARYPLDPTPVTVLQWLVGSEWRPTQEIIMATWAEIGAYVSGNPELSKALASVPDSTPTHTLAIAGAPGEECW